MIDLKNMSKIENIKVYYQLLIVIYLVHTFLFWKLFHFMGALCSKKKDNKQKYVTLKFFIFDL